MKIKGIICPDCKKDEVYEYFADDGHGNEGFYYKCKHCRGYFDEESETCWPRNED